MNDFKENELNPNANIGGEAAPETEKLADELASDEIASDETASEKLASDEAVSNEISESDSKESAENTADTANTAETSAESAVSPDGTDRNAAEAVSEESAAISETAGQSAAQTPPQPEQSGVFGEQSFASGQTPGSAAAYYSEQNPDAANGNGYPNGQFGNGMYGSAMYGNNAYGNAMPDGSPQPVNGQPYPQPFGSAQGNFGGQPNGINAGTNAPQYTGQYGGQYAGGQSMYNYSYTQYNAPYYNPCPPTPPKTPGIPAVPAAEETAVKKPSKALVIIIVLLVAAMLAGVMILLAVNHKNNGDKPSDSISVGIDKALSEHESGKESGKKDKTNSGTGVTVNINVRSKPSEDESDYQDIEKGLYTTVGVAKHITPSIVTLYGYTTTTLTPYSAATGVILSEDGFIVTNAHMVEGLSRIKAVTYDEREFEADIIGYEPWYDLAIIQIHADNLTPAELGSSDELMQGEQVVAIGNSGGYENTLTVGYVSYVNREIQSYADHPIKCIQTDAAFNTGISGGALVNMYGQVVGIPTSKSVTDNDENIGFAIAMDFAVPICEDIIENGYVTWKPRVGVMYKMIDYETAQALGVRPGMLISEISEDCDISGTALQIDDIITEMDGVSMTSDEALIEFQTTHKAGDVVTAKVYRRTITNEESEFEITFMLEKAEG